MSILSLLRFLLLGIAAPFLIAACILLYDWHLIVCVAGYG